MSESDTMFNERDWRCTAVQLMHSTDACYDNRTIASTLKMQIWIAANNRDGPRVMKTKFSATFMVLGVVSSESHIMPPPIFEVGLKVNTKVYLAVLKNVVIPWCNQVTPWQTLGEAEGHGTGPQVQRDPGSASEGVLRLCTLLSLAPPPPTWTHWTTSFCHTSRNHQHDPPTTPKPTWSPPSAEYSPSSRRPLWKTHAPVLDPYRGVDWGWRRLHWIDVSSTT